MPDAYLAGRQAGRIDRLLGHRSDASFFGAFVEPKATYAYNYSVGYRIGWELATKESTK